MTINKEKKHIKDYPELMKEWDYEKNDEIGLHPQNISIRSGIKAWWKCEKGHEYSSIVSNHFAGKGCPYCSNQKVLIGYNDLTTTNQDLVKEWHPTKNGELKPSMFVAGSSKKVWWKCNLCGNEWETLINKRTRGSDCPKCVRYKNANKKRKSHDTFINEMKVINPNITILTKYKNAHCSVLCKCSECGYEWYGRPDHLLNGHGCPNCAGNAKKSNKQFIDEMKKINPNIEIVSNYISADEKLECECKICGYNWKIAPNTLLQGVGCPQCFRRNKTSFAEQAILYYVKQYFDDSIGTYNENGYEFDIYIPSVKTAIEYDGYFWHKKRLIHDNEKDKYCFENSIRLIRVREKGLDNTIFAENIRRDNNTDQELHKILVKIMNLLGIMNTNIDLKNNKTNILGSYYTIMKENSILVKYPTLAKEWHPTKNANITPDMVYSHSGIKFWWLCPICNHEWEADPDHRSRGRGCPKCSIDKIRKTRTSTHDKFIEKFANLNTKITILGKYSHSRTPILCFCNVCNTKFELCPHDLLQGRDCPTCAKKQQIAKSRKSHDEFLIELKTKNVNALPLDEYKTARTHIRFTCLNCNYIWNSTPDNILRGKGCPKCAGNAKLSNDEFAEAVRKVNPNIKLLDIYQNSTQQITFQCMKCGYIGTKKAYNLKASGNCPLCSKIKKVKYKQV